jgi:hypothetical protein
MSDGDFIPSLTDLLGQLDEEDCKDESNEPKSLLALFSSFASCHHVAKHGKAA